jgi:hypothetical protein
VKKRSRCRRRNTIRPARASCSAWRLEDRAPGLPATFSGEAGQRVLYDLLFRLCLIGSNPRQTEIDPRGRPIGPVPDPNGVLLSGGVGRQEVGYAILETLALDMRQVIDTNRRRFGNDE